MSSIVKTFINALNKKLPKHTQVMIEFAVNRTFGQLYKELNNAIDDDNIDKVNFVLDAIKNKYDSYMLLRSLSKNEIMSLNNYLTSDLYNNTTKK